jgi:hypothetical protein
MCVLFVLLAPYHRLRTPARLSVCLITYLTVCLSLCLPACLSVRLCLYVLPASPSHSFGCLSVHRTLSLDVTFTSAVL